MKSTRRLPTWWNMLLNNYLTYAGADSVFHNWRPQSDILHEIIYSVLVTMFVYQLTKLCLELCLGQRQSGEIPVPDLYMYVGLLGISFSSVVSFFRSFMRLGQDSEPVSFRPVVKSRKSHPNARMIIKFAILLLAVPGIQVLGLFLGVEGEKDVSFKDVNFGGLALGVVKGELRTTHNDSSRCQKLEARLGYGETERTFFYRCYGITNPLPFETGKNLRPGTFIVFMTSTSTNIGVTVVVPGKRWITFLSLDIHDGTNSYYLRNTITAEEQFQIFEKGVQEMLKTCPSAVQSRGIDISWIVPIQNESGADQPGPSVLVECPEYNEDNIVNIAYGMLSGLSYVSTDDFEIAESLNAEEFISGNDFVFFRRRGSTASLLSMLIATIVVISSRVVVGLLLVNEAPKALEVILKDHLGLKCCDSVLQYEQKVRYRDQEEKAVGKISPFMSEQSSYSTASHSSC